jgi:hypothetical protein
LIRFGVLSVSTSSSFDDVDVAAVICFWFFGKFYIFEFLGTLSPNLSTRL